MSISIVSVKCPECKASLPIEEGRTQIFCSYCGAKVIITNENEFIYRHIDEAEVTQAETDQLVRLKELELEEKRIEDDKQIRAVKIKISLFLFALGTLMMVGGWLLGSASGDPDSGFYMLTIVGIWPLIGAGWIWIASSRNKKD